MDRGNKRTLHPYLMWLMSIRVVIITTILITAILVHFTTGEFFVELNTIYFLVGLTYFLTLLYIVGAVFLNRGQFDLMYQIVGLVVAMSLLAVAEYRSERSEEGVPVLTIRSKGDGFLEPRQPSTWTGP